MSVQHLDILFKLASSEEAINNSLQIINNYINNNNIEDITEYVKTNLAFIYNILPFLFCKVEKIGNNYKKDYYGHKHILQNIPKSIIPDGFQCLYTEERTFKIVCDLLGYKTDKDRYILAGWNGNFFNLKDSTLRFSFPDI